MTFEEMHKFDERAEDVLRDVAAPSLSPEKTHQNYVQRAPYQPGEIPMCRGSKFFPYFKTFIEQGGIGK